MTTPVNTDIAIIATQANLLRMQPESLPSFVAIETVTEMAGRMVKFSNVMDDDNDNGYAALRALLGSLEGEQFSAVFKVAGFIAQLEKNIRKALDKKKH